MLWPFADIVISKFPSPALPASTVNCTFLPTTPLLTEPTTTFVASYDFAIKGVPYIESNSKQNKKKKKIANWEVIPKIESYIIFVVALLYTTTHTYFKLCQWSYDYYYS